MRPVPVAALALGALMLSACQPRPVAPLQAPVTQVTVQHFVGSPISGPNGKEAPAIQPPAALGVRVTFIALDPVPGDILQAVGAQARLIASSQGDNAVLPTTRMTRGTRVGAVRNLADLGARLSTQALERQTTIASVPGALPPGMTAAFRLEDPTPVQEALKASPTRRMVEVDVHRHATALVNGPEHLELALTVQDFVAAPATQPAPTAAKAPGTKWESGRLTPSGVLPQPEAGAPAAPVPGTPPSATTQPLLMPVTMLRRETAVLDGPVVTAPSCTAFIVPFRFSMGGSTAVAVVVEVSPGSDDPVHARVLAACVAQAHEAALAVAAAQASAPGRRYAGSGIPFALDSLKQPALRRAALVFIASEGNTKICGDVALVADDETLAHLSDLILKRPRPLGTSRDSMGWTLDLLTFDLLRRMSAAGKLSKELEAVLTAYAGEAGRHPSSLEEVVNKVPSRDELDQRLLSENLIYLEDSSPSSRIRAYEWLQGHNAAPAGYDPLAPAKERRAALEAAAEAAAAPGAATQPGVDAKGGTP